jgi:hypothetical protein
MTDVWVGRSLLIGPPGSTVSYADSPDHEDELIEARPEGGSVVGAKICELACDGLLNVEKRSITIPGMEVIAEWEEVVPLDACCDAAGSGSASGGSSFSPLIGTECCPDGIPTVLNVSISASGGSCAGASASGTITHEAGTWSGTIVFKGQSVSLSLRCVAGFGGYDWALTTSCGLAGSSVTYPTSSACSPLMSATFSPDPTSLCCDGGTITVTVTDTRDEPPGSGDQGGTIRIRKKRLRLPAGWLKSQQYCTLNPDRCCDETTPDERYDVWVCDPAVSTLPSLLYATVWVDSGCAGDRMYTPRTYRIRHKQFLGCAPPPPLPPGGIGTRWQAAIDGHIFDSYRDLGPPICTGDPPWRTRLGIICEVFANYGGDQVFLLGGVPCPPGATCSAMLGAYIGHQSVLENIDECDGIPPGPYASMAVRIEVMSVSPFVGLAKFSFPAGQRCLGVVPCGDMTTPSVIKMLIFE